MPDQERHRSSSHASEQDSAAGGSLPNGHSVALQSQSCGTSVVIVRLDEDNEQLPGLQKVQEAASAQAASPGLYAKTAAPLLGSSPTQQGARCSEQSPAANEDRARTTIENLNFTDHDCVSEPENSAGEGSSRDSGAEAKEGSAPQRGSKGILQLLSPFQLVQQYGWKREDQPERHDHLDAALRRLSLTADGNLSKVASGVLASQDRR